MQTFVDPLRTGALKDFSHVKLPSFDPAKMDVKDITQARDIFADPLGLASKLRPMNIAIVGVTSDVMDRFLQHSFLNLAEAIPGLDKNVTFWGTGTRDQANGQSLVDGLKANGIPLADYTKHDDFLALIRSGAVKLDAVFIASPPALHLKHCEEFLVATHGKVKLFCEKPLVKPDQHHDMSQLLKQFPGMVVPVDFFATATPLYYLLSTQAGQQILESIGEPAVINGSLVETQAVEHNRLGGNYGLLDLGRSGGGIMIDCMIHSVQMALTFKAKGGKVSLGDSEPKISLAPASYLNQSFIDRELGGGEHGVKLENLRETGGTMSMRYKDCIVNAQGAKGVAHDMYCLDILTHTGHRLVIGVGTDFQPPYISHTTPEGVTHMTTFQPKHKEVGYGGVFYDMFARALVGPDADVIPTDKIMTQLSMWAIKQIGRVNEIPSSQFERHNFRQMHPSAIDLPSEIQEQVPRARDSRRD